MICELNWKDGVIFLFSFTMVKMATPIFNWDSVFIRVLYSFLLYSIVYIIIAFPYWLSSFFQSFSANSLVHVLLASTSVDIISNHIYKMYYK